MPHPPQIPLVPSTNEMNFPRWEQDAPPGKSGSKYPKMLTREFLPEDREPWEEKNRQWDESKGKWYWMERRPKARITRPDGTIIYGDPVPILSTQDLVDQGFAQFIDQPILVRDKEEERTICALLGIPMPSEQKAQSVSIPLGSNSAELERLRKENEELEAELARNAQLKEARKTAAQERKEEAKPKKGGAALKAAQERMAAARAAKSAKKANQSPVEAARKRSLEQLSKPQED